MSRKSVKINVTSEQLGRLRQDVFCNAQLSMEQRRNVVKRLIPFPANGSSVDLWCDGKYVGTV